MRGLIKIVFAAFIAPGALAETIEVQPVQITEWKAVYGEVEPNDKIPARARIGGTLDELAVSAGDKVSAGERIALIEDDKLNFRMDAIDAQLGALNTQLSTAMSDLERGESLSERGVITAQRLDQLRTAVDVLEGQIKGAEAERLVLEQQVAEGQVLSPVGGVVLSVPVARGSVINGGEVIAMIGGGGVFLRLALPERHASDLVVGDAISIGAGIDQQSGTLVKVYPQIVGGRVLADVDVEGLDERFIGRRVPVRLPVGTRDALLVPQDSLKRSAGLDFLSVESHGETIDRTVVPGELVMRDGQPWREILSGLKAGDIVVSPHE